MQYRKTKHSATDLESLETVSGMSFFYQSSLHKNHKSPQNNLRGKDTFFVLTNLIAFSF